MGLCRYFRDEWFNGRMTGVSGALYEHIPENSWKALGEVKYDAGLDCIGLVFDAVSSMEKRGLIRIRWRIVEDVSGVYKNGLPKLELQRVSPFE